MTNEFTKELITLIIKGLPNMVGLLILAWVLYQMNLNQITQIRELQTYLLSCIR